MTGYILAGGESSRMGEDKAMLTIAGKTLIERAADTLVTITDTVKIVGLRGEYSGHLPVIADADGRRGSIIGLYTALKDCQTEFAAVLACDLPFVDGEIISAMSNLIRSDEYLDAVIPRQTDGRLQPLCAIYRAAACLPFVERMLADDNFRISDLTAQLDLRIFNFSGDARWSVNVNTPDDLRSAIALVDEPA